MTAMALQDHPQIIRRGGGGDGESIGALHRDALYEVLLRVPAKPLCRFRAVCRSWRSLLSGPSFWAARHKDQPLLAVCDWVPGSHYKTTEIKLLDTSGHVVKRFDVGPSSLLRRVWLSSHQDLVLIVRHAQRPLSVLDTATGAVTVLPGGHYDDTRSSFAFGRAAAAASSASTGEAGEYKVLSIYTPLRRRYQFCKILTVGGCKWRDAPAPPVAIKTFHRAETVVANGVVYHLVDSTNGWTIAAFDLEAEQWLPHLLHGPTELPPPLVPPARERKSLAEVNTRLAAVYSTSSAMDMWLLMGSGKNAQWCKRCRVLTSSLEWHFLRFTPEPVPLWVLDDGRVAFRLRGRLMESGTLWMYDPRTQICTLLSDCLRIGASGYTGNLLRQS